MDLTSALLRRTRPSLFLITGVGGTACRLAVERVIREQGYRQALSPAEANLLITCGSQQGGLGDAADRVWDQLPLPRARIHLTEPGETAPGLSRALSELTDLDRQRRGVPISPPEAVSEPAEPEPPEAPEAPEAPEDHAGHDMSGMDMDKPAHDISGMDNAGHDMSGHDMAEMEMPGGLAMADRGPDRDGLSLDQLHVPLGPALPDWPAALCLRLLIQGDVVQEATAEVIGAQAAAVPFWTAELSRPAALDSLQRLLSVAGWPTAALYGRRLRDLLLTDPAAEGKALEKWSRRVRRSSLLRWSTDGLGVFSGATEASGDATARWLRWLDLAAAPDPAGPVAPAVSADPDRPSRAEAARQILDALPGLLVGQELAAVRLIVASLDPDVEAMVAGSRQGGGHA